MGQPITCVRHTKTWEQANGQSKSRTSKKCKHTREASNAPTDRASSSSPGPLLPRGRSRLLDHSPSRTAQRRSCSLIPSTSHTARHGSHSPDRSHKRRKVTHEVIVEIPEHPRKCHRCQSPPPSSHSSSDEAFSSEVKEVATVKPKTCKSSKSLQEQLKQSLKALLAANSNFVTQLLAGAANNNEPGPSKLQH